MQVNTASSQSSNSSSSTKSSSSGSTLDYNSFLKLFMAEMKNQDPTAPTSSTEYIAQFATFSQVEQSMQSNTKLDSMLSSLALSQADGIIGRTLTSEDGSVSGKVTAVRIVNGGALADLDSGKSVVLGPGRGRHLMNEFDALDLVRDAIWTIIIGSGPAVLAAMTVGIVIALLQALTQVQEITLTFIPKIVAILLTIVATGPFIGAQIYAFTEIVYGRIESGF